MCVNPKPAPPKPPKPPVIPPKPPVIPPIPPKPPVIPPVPPKPPQKPQKPKPCVKIENGKMPFSAFFQAFLYRNVIRIGSKCEEKTFSHAELLSETELYAVEQELERRRLAKCKPKNKRVFVIFCF